MKAITREGNEAIQRAGQRKTISPERLTEMIETTRAYAKFPCGLSLNEIRAQDIDTALWELQEYRQNELRPADKFLTNTLDQQLRHIEQEFFEVCEAVHECQKLWNSGRNKEAEKEWDHLKEELADLKTSCTTMEAIMGMDAADRRAEVRKVNAKNERRGYFDRGK